MEDDRRFSEQEAAFILERASSEPSDADPGADEGATGTVAPVGLTLQQLQSIAVEAGISPEAVTRAAAQVRRGAMQPTRRERYAGLPVGVARTLDFESPVSDVAWARIVMALRETFAARGRVTQTGALREWRNGNLVAVLEPTPRGHRLWLSTRKGDARGWLGLGSGMMASSAVLALPLWLTGATNLAGQLWPPALMALVGAVTLAGAVWRLPRWARERSEQMEALAEVAARIVEEETQDRDAPALPRT